MVRLTDRPYMILDVYRGRKTTQQQLRKQLNKPLVDSLPRSAISSYCNGIHGSELNSLVNSNRKPWLLSQELGKQHGMSISSQTCNCKCADILSIVRHALHYLFDN